MQIAIQQKKTFQGNQSSQFHIIKNIGGCHVGFIGAVWSIGGHGGKTQLNLHSVFLPLTAVFNIQSLWAANV